MIVLSLRSVNVYMAFVLFGKCLHQRSLDVGIVSVNIDIKSATIYIISVDVDIFNTYLRN